MPFNVDPVRRPVFSVKAAAPDQMRAQAFLAVAREAAPRAQPNPPQSREEQEKKLIEALSKDVVQNQDPMADKMTRALVLDRVKSFLDPLSPAEGQAAVLRLLQAFQKPASAAHPETPEEKDRRFSAMVRTISVREGIQYAATLSGLAITSEEATRRVGEEQFAASIYARGNHLMYRPDEPRPDDVRQDKPRPGKPSPNKPKDSPEEIAKDIRSFLDRTATGRTPKDVADKKWEVLNRLYEREWTDATPVMAAIERIAKDDFHQGLRWTLHQGAGTHAAVDAIETKANDPAKSRAWEDPLVPNQQFYDLQVGARRASVAVQRELEQVLSDQSRSPGASRTGLPEVGDFVTRPLTDKSRSLQKNGLEMFGHLDRLTQGMDGPLAAQVVQQSLDMMKHIDGLPEKPDFQGFKGGGVSGTDDRDMRNLASLHAVISRIKGTAAGNALITRMHDYGIPTDARVTADLA